ncbi:hypothetical protein Bhyg_09136 [Pseudolycoriella hygida]|uniref:Uncharacterized protein n=1 Tax=Pseudolycoriella hygida TaxID=35572 RepID=A0A9Q0S5H5_9DIPT|nr:hypothetical protein Bhyg_09136 [Pseudolycoriella hygida]
MQNNSSTAEYMNMENAQEFVLLNGTKISLSWLQEYFKPRLKISLVPSADLESSPDSIVPYSRETHTRQSTDKVSRHRVNRTIRSIGSYEKTNRLNPSVSEVVKAFVKLARKCRTHVHWFQPKSRLEILNMAMAVIEHLEQTNS